jgi:hydrogenase maturation protein HypF
MNESVGQAIHITGVVQGVGFRPFVYGLAQRHSLTGWVRNSSAGVDIAVDGHAAALSAFAYELQTTLPPLAHIDSFQTVTHPANGFTQFEIIPSAPIAGAFQPISPDVTVCPDCLREMFEPTDRRYRYPFINCTHCGPRFTIIQDIPYDRPQTTMAEFAMCPQCQAEYENPLDRRFHAQPIACPECGPRVWLEEGTQGTSEELRGTRGNSALSTQYSVLSTQHSIRKTRQLLAEGKIVAIKGLGGFHLACDATNAAAVSTLRERKLRVDKPFAVMVADEHAAAAHCLLSEAEKEVLCGRERPIVLLQRRPDSTITREVAPHQEHLGVMLPYTPLHYLLLEPVPGFPTALVMTSGNLSEEPIVTTNEESLTRLSSLADAFLLHNRDIHSRCDDSVVRILDLRLTINNSTPSQQSSIVNRQSSMILRRSRGYAPFPVKLPQPMPSILATGAELKNSFCLTRDQYAFMSHHIGDLENYETLCSFEEGIAHFERLFRVQPKLIAYDKHPNYLATRYALERAEREGIPAIGVQHHHAHIAACMAEHGLSGDRPVIGVALDGTGYGDDGTIWGGEFLVADYAGFTRPYHLQPVRLPGGDKAIREPWRMALAYLKQANIPWDTTLPPVQHATRNTHHAPRTTPLDIITHQLGTGLNAPLTSSMGRLFDAAAALIGVRQVVNYEAQAAIEMEALVQDGDAAAYPFSLENGQINVAPLWQAMVTEWQKGVGAAALATHFHNTVAQMVITVCRQIRTETSLNEVALSGGVWQNMSLLKRTIPPLQAAGFTVYWHTIVPSNDGGLALGQAMIGAYSKE